MENRLNYMIRVVKNANIKKLKAQICTAHQRSSKSILFIAFDMAVSFFLYGSGYYDYVIFEFWNLSHSQKNTYLTRFRSKKLIMQLNDSNYSHFFDNKDEFNKKFKSYIGREYIDMSEAAKEDVISFFRTHEEIFAKMKDLSCGIGCEKLKTADFSSEDSFYDYVKQKNFATLEEVIRNHPEINKIYPLSVNTLRIITLIDSKGHAHCIYVVFKMGNNGRIVDNYGLHGPVDIISGIFMYPAHSGDTTIGEHFTEHPYSHIKLIGMKVPMVKEAVELALQAAHEVPQIRYVGWDIEVTPNGPAIIEGNNYCAHDFWQLPGQTPMGIGIIPKIKEIIPEFKY